jgi:Arc/MetJ family transcription regulator
VRALGAESAALRAEARRWGPGDCEEGQLDSGAVIFKRVGDGRPYPDHATTQKAWATIPPRAVRLDQLVTTKSQLDLSTLLADDSTFYGDLFAHVVSWNGQLYLEDGLHRAVRAAQRQRTVMHARVLDLDVRTSSS